MAFMTIQEVQLNPTVLEQLLSLSEEWEQENSCHGYRKNSPEFIKGNRIFLAMENGEVLGYLFGHPAVTDRTTSIYREGTAYFEIEELYVKPAYRSRGIGRRLFQCAEKAVAGEAELLMLTTANKNYRAILHFYIEELGMEFWSACLYKRLRGGN